MFTQPYHVSWVLRLFTHICFRLYFHNLGYCVGTAENSSVAILYPIFVGGSVAMRAAHALLRRQANLASADSAQLASLTRAFSQAVPEVAAAAGPGPSSTGALSALKERLQSGPDLGDFIRGTDLSDYSVYAPKPKVRRPQNKGAFNLNFTIVYSRCHFFPT